VHRASSMTNPLRMKRWSPYMVGAALGALSWFAFGTVDKHLAITLQFEHLASILTGLFAPAADKGKSPSISWELMLIVGVFLGAFLSSRLSKDRDEERSVPTLWQKRFGSSSALRFLAAFLGGAIMVFGARLAGGCTSGHGISGTLQLAVSSFSFITLAFVTAVTTALVLYGKEGRRHVG
jgi:uncharacterized protein